MSEELVQELLKTDNEDDFIEILSKQDEDYEFNRDLWDERVVNHCMKIFNIPKEEFENLFIQNPPIDDFDEYGDRCNM